MIKFLLYRIGTLLSFLFFCSSAWPVFYFFYTASSDDERAGHKCLTIEKIKEMESASNKEYIEFFHKNGFPYCSFILSPDIYLEHGKESACLPVACIRLHGRDVHYGYEVLKRKQFWDKVRIDYGPSFTMCRFHLDRFICDGLFCDGVMVDPDKECAELAKEQKKLSCYVVIFENKYKELETCVCDDFASILYPDCINIDEFLSEVCMFNHKSCFKSQVIGDAEKVDKRLSGEVQSRWCYNEFYQKNADSLYAFCYLRILDSILFFNDKKVGADQKKTFLLDVGCGSGRGIGSVQRLLEDEGIFCTALGVDVNKEIIDSQFLKYDDIDKLGDIDKTACVNMDITNGIQRDKLRKKFDEYRYQGYEKIAIVSSVFNEFCGMESVQCLGIMQYLRDCQFNHVFLFDNSSLMIHNEALHASGWIIEKSFLAQVMECDDNAVGKSEFGESEGKVIESTFLMGGMDDNYHVSFVEFAPNNPGKPDNKNREILSKAIKAVQGNKKSWVTKLIMLKRATMDEWVNYILARSKSRDRTGTLLDLSYVTDVNAVLNYLAQSLTNETGATAKAFISLGDITTLDLSMALYGIDDKEDGESFLQCCFRLCPQVQEILVAGSESWQAAMLQESVSEKKKPVNIWIRADFAKSRSINKGKPALAPLPFKLWKHLGLNCQHERLLPARE